MLSNFENKQNTQSFNSNVDCSKTSFDVRNPVEVEKESFLEQTIKKLEPPKHGIFRIILNSFLLYLNPHKSLENETKLKAFKMGLHGELLLRSVLRELLSSDYRVIYNYSTSYGDIDAIVIGPIGVLVIEVKNFSGHITITSEEWIQVKRSASNKTYKHVIDSPEKQARRNAWYLSNILKENRINAWVDYVVVLSNPTVEVEILDKKAKVVLLKDLYKVFEFKIGEYFNQAKVEQIFSLFK